MYLTSHPTTRPVKFLWFSAPYKTLFVLLSLIIYSGTAFAGYRGYQYQTIDYYDLSSSYYYRSVTPKGKKSGFLGSKTSPRNISNIFLFNPATNQGHLLFKEQDDTRRITLFVHEEKFHTTKNVKIDPYESRPSKNQIVSFHNYGNLSLHNNVEQKQTRPLRDHILIGLTKTKTEETELWHCKKDGSELKKLITVPKKSNWHLDLKAMKLRVLIPDAKLGYKLSSFDW